MTLPTKKTPPITDLSSLTVLIHGLPKMGKSTFCSHADGALFLATEAGLNHLDCFQQPITSWEELLAAGKELAEGKHQFKTIIIDTLDNAYRFCAEAVLKKAGVDHESDLAYGKGTAMVNNEFHRVLTKLSQMPYGLFLISHTTEREVETRTGKQLKAVPSLPEKARKSVVGMVDIIMYCDIESSLDDKGTMKTRRVLRTKPAAGYEAGDRTGKLPEVLPLDYTAFLAAYNVKNEVKK